MSSRKTSLLGYGAGAVAGVSYGFNPLFAKHLLENQVPIYSMLFFRYAIAALCMGIWMVLAKESLKITTKQLPILIMLGLLFASSSMGLFEAYKYIPAGLATTICYLYPVFTALTMLFLHKRPTARTWCSIVFTLVGVGLICMPNESVAINAVGMILAIWSALSYAIYLVVVNNNSRHHLLRTHFRRNALLRAHDFQCPASYRSHSRAHQLALHSGTGADSDAYFHAFIGHIHQADRRYEDCRSGRVRADNRHNDRTFSLWREAHGEHRHRSVHLCGSRSIPRNRERLIIPFYLVYSDLIATFVVALRLTKCRKNRK